MKGKQVLLRLRSLGSRAKASHGGRACFGAWDCEGSHWSVRYVKQSKEKLASLFATEMEESEMGEGKRCEIFGDGI